MNWTFEQQINGLWVCYPKNMKTILMFTLLAADMAHADDYNTIILNKTWGIKNGKVELLDTSDFDLIPPKAPNGRTLVRDRQGLDQVFEVTNSSNGDIARISQYTAFGRNAFADHYVVETSTFQNGTLKTSTYCYGKPLSSIPCVTVNAEDCRSIGSQYQHYEGVPNDLDDMKKAKECRLRIEALGSIAAQAMKPEEEKELKAFFDRNPTQATKRLNIRSAQVQAGFVEGWDLDDQIQAAAQVMLICQNHFKTPLPGTSQVPKAAK